MIVDAVRRARLLAPDERIKILTGEALKAPLLRAVPDLDQSVFMVEPQAKGTGPALAWAAWETAKVDPEAVIVSIHADHVIQPESAFVELLHETAALADSTGQLFTIAVPPTRPETGYGYIEPGVELEEASKHTAFTVASFREKPDHHTAQAYIESGHLWNSGIFVWRASTVLSELRAIAPEIGAHLPLLDRSSPEEFFAQVPALSVDVAVLERSTRVCSVRANFEWDDVGTWEALARSREPDSNGNVVVGSGHVLDGTDNVVYAEEGTVITYGVDDLIVVQSGGKVLVTRTNLAAHLKDLLEMLPEDVRDGTA